MQNTGSEFEKLIITPQCMCDCQPASRLHGGRDGRHSSTLQIPFATQRCTFFLRIAALTSDREGWRMAGVLSPIIAALPCRNHKQAPDCCVPRRASIQCTGHCVGFTAACPLLV